MNLTEMMKMQRLVKIVLLVGLSLLLIFTVVVSLRI